MNFRLGFILAGIATLCATASAGAQEPVNNRFTALAMASLEQARAAMDSSVAVTAYQRVVDLSLDGVLADPRNSQSHFHLGIAYMGLGLYVEADESFSKAEEMWPDYLEETAVYRENGWAMAYNEGLTLMDSDDRGALAKFDMAHILFRDRPESYMNVAAIKSNGDDFEGAIDAYENVLRTVAQPQITDRDEETLARWAGFRVTALLNTGSLYLATDRAAEAAEVYQAVLDTDPENELATSNLAIALAAAGEGDAALGMYQEILDDPEASEYDFYNAGVGFYQAEVWDKAAAAFKEVVVRNPMHRDALQNMAQSMLLAAQYEEMLPYSKQLLEMDPQNDFAFRFHARALVETGSSDEGVRLMEEMAELTFVVDNLRLRAMGSTGARVEGVVVNKTLEEGAEVKLRFHFFDRTGTDLGTGDVEVATGGVDVAMAFQVEFSSDQEIGGYSYEVIT